MKYVTLYPEISNIELIKDVGQIPYNLHKFYGIDTEIISNNVDKKGNNIEYVRGVKLTRLSAKSVKGILLYFAEIKYIVKNAHKIDWLNLYHCGRNSLVLAKIFKIFNPFGKVHLKMDLDFRGCNLYKDNLRERKIFQRNMAIMDLVTVESESIRNRIQQYTSKKIYVLPDGFYPLPRKKIEQQNIFLTVGRLGTKQKATDILLHAFAQSSKYHNWNLELVGNIDSNFMAFLENFNKNHPNLKNRIIFKKAINNRKDLYAEYAKAKVFVLDSRWESFGLVLPEALSQGCSIITSDQVPIANEITNNRKFGKVVESNDINALAEAMIEMANELACRASNMEINSKIEYAQKNYSWNKICAHLNNYLEEK